MPLWPRYKTAQDDAMLQLPCKFGCKFGESVQIPYALSC